MSARSAQGVPVYLPHSNVPWLEGTGQCGKVSQVTHSLAGSFMTVTLDTGHTYRITDINRSDYDAFKAACGV